MPDMDLANLSAIDFALYITEYFAINLTTINLVMNFTVDLTVNLKAVVQEGFRMISTKTCSC